MDDRKHSFIGSIFNIRRFFFSIWYRNVCLCVYCVVDVATQSIETVNIHITWSLKLAYRLHNI